MRTRNRIVDALLGVLYAFLFVLACLWVLSLAGCANVQMTDEERKACRDAETGCAVFTEAELRQRQNEI